MALQNQEILQQVADQARGLAIDAVHACSSGHLGLPLGAAEIGAVLYGHDLKVDPTDANWLNRDRLSSLLVMEVCSFTVGYIWQGLISLWRS